MKNTVKIHLLIMLTLLLLFKESYAILIDVEIVEKGTKTLAKFKVWGHPLGILPCGEDEDLFYRRIENWSKRLENLFKNPPSPYSVKARYIRGKGIVYVGRTPILIFDEDMKPSPISLAKTWAYNIRLALKNPPIFKLSTNSVIVPLNEQVSIPFKCRGIEHIEFIDFPQNLVNVWADLKSKKIYIEGLNLGRGYGIAIGGGIEKTICFKVQERASAKVKYMNLYISGFPAAPSLIEKAFKSLLWYKSSPKPNTYVIVKAPIKSKKFPTLPAYEEKNLIVPVKFDGPNYIPTKEKVHLKVINQGYHWQEPSLLFVSNKPEVIWKDGDLFNGVILPHKPIRYFYHHKNAHNQQWRMFYISLENTGNTPVKVFVYPVGAGPTTDELFAGHEAVSEYFYGRKKDWGWIVTIKPNTHYILEKRLLKSDHTISGIGYISILEGGSLNFTCYATTIGEEKNNGEYTPKEEARTSKGVFPATIKIKQTHIIGGKYNFIYLGGKPYQRDIHNGNPNYGNYGAKYDIEIKIKNPYPEKEKAWIYFVPGGGLARGIFEVDGVLYETGLVGPAQRVLLKKLTFQGEGEKKVHIVTIPQGGSFYPVKIVVESEYRKNSPQNTP